MEETLLEEMMEKIAIPNEHTATAINMDPSQILHTVFFSYKEKDYKVIKLVRMRVGAEWCFGVEYQALYDVGPMDWSGSFIRTMPDFLLKFTPTPKEG